MKAAKGSDAGVKKIRSKGQKRRRSLRKRFKWAFAEYHKKRKLRKKVRVKVQRNSFTQQFKEFWKGKKEGDDERVFLPGQEAEMDAKLKADPFRGLKKSKFRSSK